MGVYEIRISTKSYEYEKYERKQLLIAIVSFRNFWYKFVIRTQSIAPVCEKLRIRKVRKKQLLIAIVSFRNFWYKFVIRTQSIAPVCSWKRTYSLSIAFALFQ